MILPTKLLKKMVDKIVTKDVHNTVMMKFELRNKQNPKFVIKDAFVDVFYINQNFLNNVTDDIGLKANIRPKQLLELVGQQPDLYCDIVLEYANRYTNEVILEETPIKLRYNVLIHDLSNILKRFGVKAFETTDGEEELPKSTDGDTYFAFDLQLINDEEYQINKSAFVGTVRNLNVEELIRYIASTIGIKKINLIPPDNQTKYQHIVIPPEKGSFRSVYDFLQSKFGIYANGFRHYITNGTLYVFPPFNMKSETKPKLNIIRLSEDSYLGAANYHKIEDNGDLTIVVNSELMHQTLSNISAENDGNIKPFIRSDGVFDAQVQKGSKLSLVNVSAALNSRFDNSIVKQSAVQTYIKPTLNLYEHSSIFAEGNTELMGFGWTNARYDLIVPGTPTEFIYDEKEKVMSKTGMIEHIQYVFTRSTRHLFTCSVDMKIRSDPTAQPYQA